MKEIFYALILFMAILYFVLGGLDGEFATSVKENGLKTVVEGIWYGDAGKPEVKEVEIEKIDLPVPSK